MVLSEHEPKVVLVIDGNNTSVNMKTSEALEALLDGKSILASRNSLLRIWFYFSLNLMALRAATRGWK